MKADTAERGASLPAEALPRPRTDGGWRAPRCRREAGREETPRPGRGRGSDEAFRSRGYAEAVPVRESRAGRCREGRERKRTRGRPRAIAKRAGGEGRESRVG